MSLNQNASYWKAMLEKLIAKTAGKTYFVTGAIGTGANAQVIQELFPVDQDGKLRVYSTITLALAACTAGDNEAIVIASDYTTAPTDTELGSAGTKGVAIYFADQLDSSEQVAMTDNKLLAQTGDLDIFTVTGICEVISIVGIVTTVIQTQTNASLLKTVSNSATTDICAALDITAKTAQSRMSITGTFANAMINTAKWVPVARQATSFVVQEGSIQLECAASNTGAIRRSIVYKPLSLGARIVVA